MRERFRVDDRLTLLIRTSYSSGFTIMDFGSVSHLTGGMHPLKHVMRPKG